ncbi:Zinc finger protein 622-like [Plakobranchus ocellatus]|uniref:Zinc finger protein 622-like n=1 Tax=Plakobranchus ocellatus TaxID=259542 RepID=A0AAV3YE95_9GAST|nr:Zinc finger protein 622-like [Plakobranchus ocellatus]
MASITCLACNVAFEDVELGRFHYKTDWHRYNLKRKVASLSPITLEQFEERRKLQEKENQNSAHSEDVCLLCKPCNKAFSSSNAYNDHIQSKKHKDVLSGAHKKRQKKKKKQNDVQRARLGRNVSSSESSATQKNATEEDEEYMDDDSEAESYDSYDENMIGIEECLFCSFISKSLEDNVKHMTTNHGFFLPDAEFIIDLEGLITYLGEKVGAGRMCLWCDEKGKRFHNTKDAQRHMIDKGHCKMLHEGDVVFEYADFYDYTPSYPDGEEPGVNPDDIVNPSELESDGFTLTLPSGATVGHRSLMHFYQQNLIPYNRDSNKKVLPKMLAHYKALGWTGTTGTLVEQRVKDLQYMRRMRSRYHMQLGCKANKLQRHFRDPNGP